MDPHRGWPPGSGGSVHPSNSEQGQSQPPRSASSYGPGTPQHQTQPSPSSAQSGLPPPGSSYQYHQQSHSGLASLAGISQSSPRQPSSGHRQDASSQPPQGPGYALPGLRQATGELSGAERERERAREAEQTHIKEEEDRRYREQERSRLEQVPPHQQTPTGQPIHLHQPVAVGPRTVHGPNGLLGNPGLAGPGQPQLPLGAPQGPGNIFAGGPVQPATHAQGPSSQPMQQQALLMPFAPGSQAQGQQQQMGQGQGQQPILNDALSYLDQVKVQFADHPDVYNRFLDIMKDFKSGAIDTPGVIGRVSQLFAGNPDLIQGFNTFLPPGYRIECGAGDDPNAIRVTTPMGTTVQSMPQPRPLSRQEQPIGDRNQTDGYTPQPAAGAQMMFSPSGRPVGPAPPGQQLASPMDAARQQEQQAMHQQEQRGVSSLQNAISAATGNPAMRAGMSPRSTPMPGQDMNAMAAEGQAGMEKRGPVEFNHAIGYVNKIKNRFSQHPDIYKQFLEILQTYQRESKPIQDVYSQVTHLFKTAPDLLEDFKQFLPESAAQAKAAERARQQAEENAIMSNVRSEGGGMYGSPVMPRDTQMGTPSHGRGLPPVGNFAPTPISKDNKRKRNDRQGTVGSVMDNAIPTKMPAGGQPNKRVKGGVQLTAKDVAQQPPTSPSLVPALPAPLPPSTTATATSDELAFFDRVKKALGNKNSMNEFLKLCNLFSQDIVDRSALIFRARAFIGGYPDLMAYFTKFVGYDEREIVVDNKPRIPTGRISLSNCRGLGPSYRLLPKRERQKPCSGRDELCNSVLNDEWASHPTWASEDSGFIAHRKNVHEEGLHRIEEERHDYDYNIEACNRTIQLLEPIAQQLRRMGDAEQQAYKLPPGLGGQSETIYKRVIMKLYGRDKGAEVIDQLHRHPYQVIPILLNRLKERLESWKMAQREWEKVWREQTQKMFWKSLDHQAVNAGRNDKRQFQAKHLQTEITNMYEAMRKQENAVPGTLKKPQVFLQIDDMDILVDASVLLLTYVEYTLAQEVPKLATFIREFVPLFFGMDPDAFNAQVKARMGDTPPNEIADELLSGAEDSSSGRGRKGKTGNLLRTALDRGRGGKLGRKDREDSNASGSRASTPDVASVVDEDTAMETADDAEKVDQGSARWFEHPVDQNQNQAKNATDNVDPNEPHKRHTFRFWANTPIYCFVRMFVTLYERLQKLKATEADVRDIVKNGLKFKPATELGIMDKVPGDFFSDTSASANYYSQMLNKFEDVLRQDIEFVDVEETLRRYYLQTGYPLYTFEKMIIATGRFAQAVFNGEGKDKSFEIWQLFRKDRVRETTTAPQQSDYRKAVEKMIKEGDLFKIDYDQPTGKIEIFLAKKDSPSYFDDGLSPLDLENRWRSYIATYQTVDPTDGVDSTKLALPFLPRNMRTVGVDPKSHSYPPSPPANAGDSESASVTSDRLASRIMNTNNEENLVMRIAVNNYKAIFQKQTQESWSEPLAEREGGKEGVEGTADDFSHREEVMKDSYLMNNDGMKGLSKDEVEKKNEVFVKICNGEEVAAPVVAEGEGEAEKMEVDG